MNFHKIKDKEDIIFSPIGHLVDSSETLRPGFYQVKDNSGPMEAFKPRFVPFKSGDSLIKFTSGIINKILKKFEVFFSKEVSDKYKDLEMTHKLGIILHGPPGTGKTALAQLLMMQEVENHKAICLDFTGLSVSEMINTLLTIREYQSTPIIGFYDEFERISRDTLMLPFLDGTWSFSNFIFLGCTNYLSSIEGRIKDRKSRIKHVFEIKTLETTIYKEYIMKKLPKLEKKELDEYVYKAAEADLTIDQLKNSIIDYYIDGDSIEKSIKEAKKLVDPTPPELKEEDD